MKNAHNAKKVAIVYDWMDKWGGVERVLLYLHAMFPDAVFFTSAYDRKKAVWASGLTIKTSFMQHIPACLRSRRALMMPLFPLAFETFDFSEFDLVISVTSSYAKGIVTKPGTTHVCYLLTPMRYAWSHSKEYLGVLPQSISRSLAKGLQKFDVAISKRPDAYISLSKVVAKRCRDYYGIESPVVYPPFDVTYWRNQEKIMRKVNLPKEYFLSVGRMEKYKRVDLVVRVAAQMPEKQFVFVGVGEEEKYLHKTAGKNCLFMGRISDNELAYVYSHASALIMPQNEDFGYVSLEAQFFGCPVIAYGSGGALETVLEGKTGMFFEKQTVSSLLATLARFEQISYNLSHQVRQTGRTHVEMFDGSRFEKDFFYQLDLIKA